MHTGYANRRGFVDGSLRDFIPPNGIPTVRVQVRPAASPSLGTGEGLGVRSAPPLRLLTRSESASSLINLLPFSLPRDEVAGRP